MAEEIGLADMLMNLQGLAQSGTTQGYLYLDSYSAAVPKMSFKLNMLSLTGCGSILEVMIMALLQESSVKMRRPATVSMVKRSERRTGMIESK